METFIELSILVVGLFCTYKIGFSNGKNRSKDKIKEMQGEMKDYEKRFWDLYSWYNDNHTPSSIPFFIPYVGNKKGELVKYLNDGTTLPPNNPTQYQPLESETINFGQPDPKKAYTFIFDGGDEIDVTKIAVHDPSTGKTYRWPVGIQPISTLEGKVSDVKLEIGRTWSKAEIEADAQKILNNGKSPTPPEEKIEAIEKHLGIEYVEEKVTTKTKTTPAHYQKKVTKNKTK